MQDTHSPYWYLPGGRVALGETAEAALLRELQEEMGLTAAIQRPLWLHQSFFKEDVSGLLYHELCLYFLMEAHPALLARGAQFATEEKGKPLTFQWLPVDSLPHQYFYPLFLKTELTRLPSTLTLRTDIEDATAVR